MACSCGGSGTTWPCPRFQSNINAAVIQSQCHTMSNAMFSCGTFLCPPEMGSELPGPVTMPGAVVGAGQVRMGGAMPGRGGKRRSGG